MKALENELQAMQKSHAAHKIVRTTDATVTTLLTQQIPVNHSLGLSGYVVARRTGGVAGSANDGALYRVEFGAKNSAGTAALIGGAGSVTTIAEDQAGWNVTLSASGINILVRVTGAADNNVTWAGSFRTFAVKE